MFPVVTVTSNVPVTVEAPKSMAEVSSKITLMPETETAPGVPDGLAPKLFALFNVMLALAVSVVVPVSSTVMISESVMLPADAVNERLPSLEVVMPVKVSRSAEPMSKPAVPKR